MKLLSIGIFLFIFLSCSKKRTDQNEISQTTVTTSAEKTEVLDKQKNIAVIYHSIDGGINWTPFDHGIPPDATVSSFLIINDMIFVTTDHSGIYSIREGEREWKRIDENLNKEIDINAIAAVNNVLAIGTFKHGIMLSKDNGKTWEHSVNPINYPVRSFLVSGNILFAGTDKGIYKSLDRGNTWDHTWGDVQVNGFTVMNDDVYAALMNGAVVTSDHGKSWRYIYEPHTLHDIATDGQRIFAMTLGDGLKKSENAGMTWENANSGLGTLNLYTFEVKSFANKLYAAQWHGIYVSDNWGINWKLIKNGLPDSTAFTTLEATKHGLIAGIGGRKK